jgi:hypothetical protein
MIRSLSFHYPYIILSLFVDPILICISRVSKVGYLNVRGSGWLSTGSSGVVLVYIKVSYTVAVTAAG